MRSLLALVFATAAVASARPAEAGYCIGSDEQEAAQKALLKVSAGARDKETVESVGLWCLIHGPILGKDDTDRSPTAAERAKRELLVTKQCTKILERTKKPAGEDPLVSLDRECGRHLVAHGVTAAGSRDLFADVTGGKYSWHELPPYEIVATSRDARARPFVIDQLRAAIAGRGTQKLKGWKVKVWTDHRLLALDALAKVGTAEDIALIDEILAATPASEKKVIAAAKRARDAAQARPIGSPP